MTGQAVIEVRTAASAGEMAGAMREAGQALDKNLPVGTVQTQDQVVNRSLGEARSLQG